MEVDKMFQLILQRLPSKDERLFWSQQTLSDSVLAEKLACSKEGQIQVEQSILKLYRRVFGVAPTTEMLAFLRVKYQQYGWNVDRLMNLLLKINLADGEPNPKPTKNQTIDGDQQDVPKIRPADFTNSWMPMPPLSVDVNSPFLVDHSDQQYEILSQINKGTANLKNCPTYADEVSMRQRNELKYACDRYAKYQSEVEDGGVIPDRFGTNLCDAANTQVGSILPRFKYEVLKQ